MDSLEAEQIDGMYVSLRKAFDSFDTDKKGAITTETVGTILRMMGVKISEKNLQEVIAETDVDGSGELEFEEFVELAAKFLIEEDEEALKEELREAFRIYDKGGDGYITTDTLREILRELDNRLTEEDLDGIIEEVDEDGSGTLDFDEFMEMMSG
ncbi:troponin C, isotype gamma-like isoform X1 [Portunus trituberculatus]|uniref:troponin C, isotype gamma-like isoform X1 n=1 Tax=Portunus trituberculatus TaxID=210409 RepID=UPI001E1CCF28|nr:troponin C, isotype gamma-like isoform X1 [Portunus trituberculatus]